MVVDWDTFSLKRSLNKNSTTKISVPQMMKSMKFLNECGICISGIDLSEKKPVVSKVETIEITYPDNPIMLIGLRVLGLAQSELATRKNDDILLGCDYRMLKTVDDEITSILKEFINQLSDSIQNLVLSLDQYYLDSGMKCNVELVFFCTHFLYSYKRKAIWRFSVSFHYCYRFILKTKNTGKYADVIDGFTDYLWEKITKGRM